MRLYLIFLLIPFAALSQTNTIFKIDSTHHEADFFVGSYSVKRSKTDNSTRDWQLNANHTLVAIDKLRNSRQQQKVGTWRIEGDSLYLQTNKTKLRRSFKLNVVIWRNSLKYTGFLSGPDMVVKASVIVLSDSKDFDLTAIITELTGYVKKNLKIRKFDDDLTVHTRKKEVVTDFFWQGDTKFGMTPSVQEAS